jgi:hypothetical protein
MTYLLQTTEYFYGKENRTKYAQMDIMERK